MVAKFLINLTSKLVRTWETTLSVNFGKLFSKLDSSKGGGMKARNQKRLLNTDEAAANMTKINGQSNGQSEKSSR
jgi:hypothetical protein